MENISAYRLRKCSDIEMEFAYFEVLDQKDIPFMDVSKTDSGELRVTFYAEIASKWISLVTLEEVLAEASRLLAEE